MIQDSPGSRPWAPADLALRLLFALGSCVCMGPTPSGSYVQGAKSPDTGNSPGNYTRRTLVCELLVCRMAAEMMEKEARMCVWLRDALSPNGRGPRREPFCGEKAWFDSRPSCVDVALAPGVNFAGPRGSWASAFTRLVLSHVPWNLVHLQSCVRIE